MLMLVIVCASLINVVNYQNGCNFILVCGSGGGNSKGLTKDFMWGLLFIEMSAIKCAFVLVKQSNLLIVHSECIMHLYFKFNVPSEMLYSDHHFEVC